jgi:hypothetical protein
MLSEKEIKRLEKSTKKWIPKVLLIGCIFYLVMCFWNLYYIQKLVSRNVYTWEKVFTDESINLNKTYSGVQVFVEFQVQKVILMFGSSIIFFIFYLTSKQRIKYNSLLLYYTKQEKEKKSNEPVQLTAEPRCDLK